MNRTRLSSPRPLGHRDPPGIRHGGRRFPDSSQHRAVNHPAARPGRGRRRVSRAGRVSGFGVFAAEPDVQNPIAMAWDRRGRLWIAENYTYADGIRSVRPPPSRPRADLRRHRRRRPVRPAHGLHRRRADASAASSSAWAASGCSARRSCCSSPTATATTSPTGPPKSCSMGSRSPSRTITRSPTACAGDPTAGSTAVAGPPRRARSAFPARPTRCACPSAAASGAIIRSASASRSSPTGRPIPGATTGTRSGEAFFINTVNGHLWHLIPGAHLVRPHTIEPNPRAYALIDQHADHWHWDNSRPLTYGSKVGPDDGRLGGGHAHSGLMIYLADQWPEEYRGKLFTLNFHGRRVNVERLERSGSGYVGRHEPDILFAGDPWFRGIDLGYGPDGGVLRPRLERYRRMPRPRGRPPHLRPDLQGHATAKPAPRWRPATSAKLDERRWSRLHRHPNEWFVRQARRVLADRAARGVAARRVPARPSARLFDAGPRARATSCRALWSLVRHRRGRRAVPPRLARPRARIRPRLGDPAAHRRPADRHDLQSTGSARTSTRPPTSCRSSPRWPATIARAWSGWCWARRSSGCRWPAHATGPAPALPRRGRRRPQPAVLDLDGT